MKVKVTKAAPYVRLFDYKCFGWAGDPTCNRFFLERQQDYANEKLKMNGYLFLNEVFDMVGLPRTKAGQIVGWVRDENNTNGDNYIDFGLLDEQRSGIGEAIVLNFNVDGDILERI